ncbi:MAG TPA: hypothetical protein VJ824_02210 [Bacillota bacterium]|nr:hypothetical protein [Bacillota bacterium]
MKVTLEQLKKLLSTYRLKVLRIHPHDHGFLVETNKGIKVVTIWDNGELLKWSNRWREEVAIQGGTGVERFLVNVNKKKYIRYQGKYYVISSVPEGHHPDVYCNDECMKVGELFARYHSALDRIDQGSVTPVSHSQVDEKLFTEATTWIKQLMQSIEQKQEVPTLIDEIIYMNLPLIYDRFRRAFQLWEGIKDSISYLPLSTVSYHLEQMTKNDEGWYIGGGYNQPLAPLHQDTVQLIREVYEKSEWKIEAVGGFLKGYNNQRNLTDSEWVYILMQLAVPWEVWKYFTEYSKQGNLSDDQVDLFLEAINRQKYWDDLTRFVARLIDRKMEASA